MQPEIDRVDALFGVARRNVRQIETPEGVTLDVEVAGAGERLAAFLVDLVIWVVATALLFLALLLPTKAKFEDEVLLTLVLFGAFLLRNLYFIHFELSTQGMTPGKRVVGVRVIDRKGGPLTASAIVARNLTREVETFLPLGLYLSLGAASGWTIASYLAWMTLVSALPLFNRDRLRAGDIIAGTMVIALPRRVLLQDLAETQERFGFTSKQLDAYGAFEVQVLEEVLRRQPSPQTEQLRQEICDKIARRIGWTSPVDHAACGEFLQAFYTAQRAHLERQRLFGKYRADKDDAPD
jgi:uncharacterized RDD family membrane protein YckC